MYRHLLILPDGTELYSGIAQENAIQSVKLTRQVNSGEELNLGSACACMLEAVLLTPEGGLSLNVGDTVTLYRVDEAENRQKMGVFYLEKPTRPAACTMELTAYDAVSRLDKDLTQWLVGLDQWPYALREFADLVCTQCGLVLREGELPNGDFYIQPFAGEAVTGRHLMQWLGQIAGRFCRATPEGELEFAWYRENDALTIGPTEGEGQLYYYQGELSFADYTTMPIEKVQLRQSAEDVGTLWPDEAGERNTYVVENNPMLAAQDADTLVSVAQTLYDQLKTVSYTPCRVVIPAENRINPGDILKITESGGKTLSLYVMKTVSDGQRDTLEGTGSHRRDSTTAVNNLHFRALSGKVLNLRTDVDGLKVENRDTQGRLASVNLDLEGIRSRVESQSAELQNVSGSVSSLTQTAQSLSIELTTIREKGTDKVKTGAGYTFDDQGLRITRTDSDMENTLDHSGMCVRRNGKVLLQADNQGVLARDVTVENYLIVGGHARFEDYGSDRTACYYIG